MVTGLRYTLIAVLSLSHWSPTTAQAAPPGGTPLGRQPFQQFVSGDTLGEACAQILVPEGKRLTIEAFTAEASGAIEPVVHLITKAEKLGTINNVRVLSVQLRPVGTNMWTGEVRTLLFTGLGADPNGWSFSYMACVGGVPDAIFRGFVSGYVEAGP
jgi:hypothetical protein